MRSVCRASAVLRRSASRLTGRKLLKLAVRRNGDGKAVGNIRDLKRRSSLAHCDLDKNKTTFVFATKDFPGALHSALKVFDDLEVNLTRIESRLSQTTRQVNFFVDVDLPATHRKVKVLSEKLAPNCVFLEQLGSAEVPWFPVTLEEVDSCALLTLESGTDLQSPDHPGFHDEAYRARRRELVKAAEEHHFGDEIAVVDYSEEEVDCWAAIWRGLYPVLHKHACAEYLESLNQMERECALTAARIPQLNDLSHFLYPRTGFRLRPSAGLLSARHFLNGLAFNTLFCPQYMRHSANPLYTPEPDVAHNVIGHVPLLANPDFARFSQAIGLASIGASDEQIIELARCYWFSMEFGLCQAEESGETKIYGAGLLSSLGEIENCMSGKPEIHDWDPFEASKMDFPITEFQPVYYLAKSFSDAKDKLQTYAASMKKPFSVTWDDRSEKLQVDANVVRAPKRPIHPGLGC